MFIKTSKRPWKVRDLAMMMKPSESKVLYCLLSKIFILNSQRKFLGLPCEPCFPNVSTEARWTMNSTRGCSNPSSRRSSARSASSRITRWSARAELWCRTESGVISSSAGSNNWLTDRYIECRFESFNLEIFNSKLTIFVIFVLEDFNLSKKNWFFFRIPNGLAFPTMRKPFCWPISAKQPWSNFSRCNSLMTRYSKIFDDSDPLNEKKIKWL